MKKTYFEAPALELVKVQTMQVIATSPTMGGEGGSGIQAGSHGYQGILEDDTEEEEE